ncbi:hypothetical protein CLTEP_02430 [Clostridium tepidiprofundi DSM 19306]|uniref:Uncharacterized protein n=1 Tax=Clostridium tepidiprofundi DSM 19306 TaxID=1121338 RepID=A0A151B7T9_9CLOT|nr:hypothetical protein [Clostridium tepidiprofundi]KYH35850.1 hypothetical protein CLTEP_02430 [Clostridium tepidiprofundi DSM 19306]
MYGCEWRDKLNDILDNNRFYERNYSIKYKCRYKKNGKWIKAMIDLEHGIIYGLNGQVVRRCQAWH